MNSEGAAVSAGRDEIEAQRIRAEADLSVCREALTPHERAMWNSRQEYIELAEQRFAENNELRSELAEARASLGREKERYRLAMAASAEAVDAWKARADKAERDVDTLMRRAILAEADLSACREALEKIVRSWTDSPPATRMDVRYQEAVRTAREAIAALDAVRAERAETPLTTHYQSVKNALAERDEARTERDRLRAELERVKANQQTYADTYARNMKRERGRAERAEAERDEAKALHGEDVAVIFDRAWRAARMTRERAERAEAERDVLKLGYEGARQIAAADAEKLARAEAELRKAREALKPFVDAYNAVDRTFCPEFRGPEALAYFDRAASWLGGP